MKAQSQSARDAWLLLYEFFDSQKFAFFAMAEEFGITPIQVHLIRGLDAEQFLPMGQTVAAKVCDRSTVTRLVDRLVSDGLVERREAESDRRVKELRLTPQGQALRERIVARLREPPPAMAELSEDDLQRLIGILGQVVRSRSALSENAAWSNTCGHGGLRSDGAAPRREPEDR